MWVEQTYFRRFPCLTRNWLQAALLCLAWLGGFSAYAQSLQQDSLILVNLYNQTEGGSWENQTNWLTSQPLNTWYGVTVHNGRVIALSLPFNNLQGVVSDLGYLSSLQVLDLSHNGITSLGTNPLPITLIKLRCNDNRLEFGPLQMIANSGPLAKELFPQNLVGIEEHTVTGNELILSVDVSGSGNDYLWLKDDLPIDSNANPSSRTASLEIASNDSGVFRCVITNVDFPGEKLISYPSGVCYSGFWGDANGDGYADVRDLGMLAGNYGVVGSPNVCGMPRANWGNVYPFDRDLKYADSNGDGIINEADTIGLNVHYDGIPSTVLAYVSTSGQGLNSSVTSAVVVNSSIVTNHEFHFSQTISGIQRLIYVQDIIPPAGYVVMDATHDASESALADGDSNFVSYSHFFPKGSETSSGLLYYARMEVGLFRSDYVFKTLTPSDNVSHSIVKVEEVLGKGQTTNNSPVKEIPIIFRTHVMVYGEDGLSALAASTDTLMYRFDAETMAYLPVEMLSHIESIYPNPLAKGDILSVDYMATESLQVELSLWNLYGNKVYQETQDVRAGGQTLTFSTDGLPAGVYILKAHNGTQSESRKVLIH